MTFPNVLVVDIGNTAVVLGLWSGDTLVASWRVAALRERTADEYGTLFRQLLGERAGEITGAIAGSVVPPLNGTIAETFEKYFGVRALFVEPGVRTGLSIHTENPLEVGADRIANAVAAHHELHATAIVVDFGTATTFDLVSEKGEYRGGVIAPGLEISAEALFTRAARLPRVDIRRPAHLIGANTVASMQSGIFYGYVGLVDGILERMKAEVPDAKAVIATGSIGVMLADESRHIQRFDPELTMKGLKLIYDRNQTPRKGGRR
jgi:type III pantothenate kinase